MHGYMHNRGGHETIAGEVCVVARGEFADAMMAQGERQARVKDAPASCVRFSRPAPDAFHHGRNFSRMIDERPGRMLAELLDEARGIGTVQRVLDDRRVAQEDVKFDQHEFAEAISPGVVGSEAKKARASAYSWQSRLSE